MQNSEKLTKQNKHNMNLIIQMTSLRREWSYRMLVTPKLLFIFIFFGVKC